MADTSPSTPQQPKLAKNAIDWRTMHLWEIQPVRDLLVIAAIIGLVYVGYLIRIVTVPLLLALLLAYLFEPLVRLLRRRRICSRQTAALGIILAFGLVVVVPVALGGMYAVVKGADAAGSLATNIAKVQKSVDAPDDTELKAAVPPGAWTRIRDFLAEQPVPPNPAVPPDGVPPHDPAGAPTDAAPGVPVVSPPAEDVARHEARELMRRASVWLQEHASDVGRSLGTKALGSGAQAVGVALGTVKSLGLAVFTGLLTAFFFYFFSTGWGSVLEFWEGLIPEKRRGRVVEIVMQMDRVIAGFVRGRLTIVFIMMIFLTIAYTAIGVPSGFILGPIIGAIWILPFVQAIGMPIAMLLLWFNAPAEGLHAQWWWIVFAPIGVHMIAQPLDDYFLTPRIQGKTTDLSIPTILFASLAGGALAGVYGLLIAIPIAACLRILMKEVFWPRFREWAEGKRSDFLPIEKSQG